MIDEDYYVLALEKENAELLKLVKSLREELELCDQYCCQLEEANYWSSYPFEGVIRSFFLFFRRFKL